MISQEQINEWLEEIKIRPNSAQLIIRMIGMRLIELTVQNESLLEENIALRMGTKVEEYERQLTHLNYQLELLKRQFNRKLSQVEIDAVGKQIDGAYGHADQSKFDKLCSLIYGENGQILCLELDKENTHDGMIIGRVGTPQNNEKVNLRMVLVPIVEELIWLFSSGRVATLPVASLVNTKDLGDDANHMQFRIIHEPLAGEELVCLAPIAKIALSDFIIQMSRRASFKKINKSMFGTIFSKHYIGSGVRSNADRSFSLTLANSEDILIIVSSQGYLQSLTVMDAPVSIERLINLDVRDHLVAAFVSKSKNSIFVVTQTGKIVLRILTDEIMAESGKSRGYPLFSANRRNKGVRVIGAAPIAENTKWIYTLDNNGSVIAHEFKKIVASGLIKTDSELIAFGIPSE